MSNISVTSSMIREGIFWTRFSEYRSLAFPHGPLYLVKQAELKGKEGEISIVPEETGAYV